MAEELKEKIYAVEVRSYQTSGKDNFVIKATSLIEALNKFTDMYKGIEGYWLACYELKEEEISGVYELYFLKEDFAED